MKLKTYTLEFPHEIAGMLSFYGINASKYGEVRSTDSRRELPDLEIQDNGKTVVFPGSLKEFQQYTVRESVVGDFARLLRSLDDKGFDYKIEDSLVRIISGEVRGEGSIRPNYYPEKEQITTLQN